MAEELRELKVLLKSREDDNYSKDVVIATLDRELASLIGRCAEFEKEVAAFKSSFFKYLFV